MDDFNGIDLTGLENEVGQHSEHHPSSSWSSDITDYENDTDDKEEAPDDIYNDIVDELLAEAIWELCFEVHKAEKERDDIYKVIVDELLVQAMWELCFEVHKAFKLGYFFLDPCLQKKKDPEGEKDIFRLKSKVPIEQICPICKDKCLTSAFASHFAKCIGISKRNSARAATRKTATDFDENDSESDSSISSSRKKSKKTHGKKTQKKSKLLAGSSSKSSLENNANFEDMNYEERKAFFKQKCGVITKTNKMCMNSHKCSQHTDDEKREIRYCLLRDMSEQLISDGQIDVDTVDEGNCGYFFS